MGKNQIYVMSCISNPHFFTKDCLYVGGIISNKDVALFFNSKFFQDFTDKVSDVMHGVLFVSQSCSQYV